jgi:hypothetical protein
MSQQIVEVVIHNLLTNEDLRMMFAIDPFEALADLNLRGFELTPDEIGMFIRMHARLRHWSSELIGARVH